MADTAYTVCKTLMTYQQNNPNVYRHIPTLCHQLIDNLRTSWRRWESVAGLNPLVGLCRYVNSDNGRYIVSKFYYAM